jgi:hypothetical protein
MTSTPLTPQQRRELRILGWVSAAWCALLFGAALWVDP